MRLIVQYLTQSLIVAMMVIAVGCDADNANFAEPENVVNPESGVDTDKNEGDGYLAIADVAIAINTDSELISTKASSYNEADDTYLVFIHNEDSGEEVYRNTYATTKALTENIVLPVGNYNVSAMSIEEVPTVAWDQPEYASANRSITIGSDKTTEVGDEIICTMSNIKTSVEMSADLKALFKPDEDVDEAAGEYPLQVILSLGDADITYYSSESRSGYFAVNPDDSTIAVTLRGMYNTAAEGSDPVYAPIEWKQNISDVAAGQARNISVQIANYNNGVLEIKFVVESWVYDEVLGVQMSTKFYTAYEEEIYDPDSEASDPYSPVVTLDGNTTLIHYIYPEAFDDIAMSYTPTYSAIMTPQVGSEVTNVMLMLSSTNEAFNEAVAEAGYGSSATLWANESANSDLADLVTVSKDASGVVTATATYEGMKLLNDVDYRGIHTAKLIVTDSEGRRSVTNLTINSVTSNVLDIIWVGGYSFDETYEIMATDDVGYEALPVVLNMTSMAGLTAVKITINSEVLTPEELLSIGLAQDMDLINPGEMEGGLTSLGFPVGDAVKGATDLTFDISSFMPMLAMLSEEGSKAATSFVITVEDDSEKGQCVKTLSVVRK